VAPASTPVYLSLHQTGTLLTLFAQSLEAGLGMPAIVRSGALFGLPPSAAAKLTADADLGVPLSVTLRELGLLDAASQGLLRAKEMSGGVPDALRAIAERLAHRRQVRWRLITILLYPLALLFAAAVITPLPLLFTSGLHAYAARVVPAVFLILGVPLFVFLLLPRLDPGGVVRGLGLRLASALPLAGAGVRNGAIASFADVLGACLKAGISMREALPLAADAASGDPAFAHVGPHLQERLDRGETLAQIVSTIPALPPIVVAQISSGELSGTLDTTLEAVRKEHEQKSRTAWLFVSIFVGATCALLVLGGMAAQIIGGFSNAMNSFDRAIDTVAPPSP